MADKAQPKTEEKQPETPADVKDTKQVEVKEAPKEQPKPETKETKPKLKKLISGKQLVGLFGSSLNVESREALAALADRVNELSER